MLQWLIRRNQLRRSGIRDARFTSQIEDYRRRELEPRGLDSRDMRLVRSKKNRRVYMDERHVWKYFRKSQRRYALNFSAAAKLLDTTELPHVQMLHFDCSQQTLDRYRLCALVMKRIPGADLSQNMSRADWGGLARLLSGLHQVRSKNWGECHRPEMKNYVEQYFQVDVERELECIEKWNRSRREDPLPDLRRWFRERASGASPMSGGHCLVSADAHPHNFFRHTDGSIYLIDLDRTRFLDFPLDLVYLIFSCFDGPLRRPISNPMQSVTECENEANVFIRPYFEALPENYRHHWEQTRHLFIVRVLLRDVWSMIRSTDGKYDYHRKKRVSQVVRKITDRIRCIRELVQ